MAFAGLRGTGDWGTDERPKNFREFILWANPNGMAPLTALMARMAEESVDDAEFAWFEEKQTPIRLQVAFATGFSTTATTLTIAANGLRLETGRLLLVEKVETSTYDNEVVEVSSITSDTVIVVKRGAANTTAVPILQSAYMTVVGSAFQEGTRSPTISQRNPTKVRNYTEIFKTKCGITGTANATHARTGDAWDNDKIRKSFDHSAEMEMAFLFGRAYEDTSGTEPKRFTAGLRSMITTNQTHFTTTPTEDTLLDALYPIWDYSVGRAGDERIGFCGNLALNALNKLARDSSSTRINFDNQIEKVYGMRLMRWTFPQGTLLLKTHPLLNLHGRFSSSMFVVDPSVMKYRYLKGRDTKFKDNVQENDKDAREGLWTSEVGLELHHECTCAYISNFTKP